MKSWESLIDQKIREAMEQGEFDDLPGKGEPVDLSENPFEDPELRLAHRMLRSAGFVIDDNPEEEVYVCRPGPLPSAYGAIYPARPPAHTIKRVGEVAA